MPCFNNNYDYCPFTACVGLLCAARFSQDGKWYRASVTRYLGNHSVTVKYVDYGNSEDVDLLRYVDTGMIPAGTRVK